MTRKKPQLPARHVSILAEHAEQIRLLGKRAIADVIEIGRLLTEAKALCKHGEWLPWLDREFGWEERTARRFMSVHDLSLKSDNLSDLELPVSGLYALAAPSTPEEAREAVIDAAKDRSLSVNEVKLIITEVKAKPTTVSPVIRRAAQRPKPLPEPEVAARNARAAQVEALKAAWEAADPEARKAFMDEIGLVYV